MARLAISVLFLTLLVLETSAQSGETLIDDADYEYSGSGSGDRDYPDPHYPDLHYPEPGEWYEPEIPHDANWTQEICLRYRQGARMFSIYSYRKIMHLLTILSIISDMFGVA